LADIEYPEDKYRDLDHHLYGGRVDMAWRDACFCWCFWNLSVEMTDLVAADDIVVRAMDESMNIQPRDMYWSVLGMMNNPWFRVKITKDGDRLTFEHPTQPALIPGGWMEAVKKSGGNLLGPNWGESVDGSVVPSEIPSVPTIDMKKPGLNRIITLEEFQQHKSATEPWFVVEGEVYDGTPFLEGHPGGAQSIISPSGTDATEEFMAIRKSPFPTESLSKH
jgi:nitrate reductase (NAD(P)H)